MQPEKSLAILETIDRLNGIIGHFLRGAIPQVGSEVFRITFKSLSGTKIFFKNPQGHGRGGMIPRCLHQLGQGGPGNLLNLSIVIHFQHMGRQGIEHGQVRGKGDGNQTEGF